MRSAPRRRRSWRHVAVQVPARHELALEQLGVHVACVLPCPSDLLVAGRGHGIDRARRPCTCLSTSLGHDRIRYCQSFVIQAIRETTKTPSGHAFTRRTRCLAMRIEVDAAAVRETRDSLLPRLAWDPTSRRCLPRAGVGASPGQRRRRRPNPAARRRTGPRRRLEAVPELLSRQAVCGSHDVMTAN